MDSNATYFLYVQCRGMVPELAMSMTKSRHIRTAAIIGAIVLPIVGAVMLSVGLVFDIAWSFWTGSVIGISGLALTRYLDTRSDTGEG